MGVGGMFTLGFRVGNIAFLYTLQYTVLQANINKTMT